MKSILSLCLIVLLVGCKGETQEKKQKDTKIGQRVGSVEQMDEELSQVLDPKTQPEIIGEGFTWSEGPVWMEKHQFLLFSDVPTNTIYKWKKGEGVSQYLKPSGFTGNAGRGGESGSNGLIIDQQGQLVLCQHGDRRVARMQAPLTKPQPEFETIAATYQDKKFNSPNDIVQHSSGAFYFTDPPYGLQKGEKDPNKELPYQGVYRVDTTGTVTLLVDSLSRPNGLVFSPDEKTLYVANSNPQNPIWMAYDVMEDGKLANGRVFYDAREEAEKYTGLPDGLKVDDEGYIYATGPGGVWIFAPDGRRLGRIDTGQETSNCAIGNDGTMLYITADMYLMRIPLK